MRPFIRIVPLILSIVLSQAIKAQTVVDITTNTNSSVYGSGVLCSNCDIIISPGVTLTINSTCTCNNCTFSGGTLDIASGSNFTLNGTDSFKNETVLINQSVNSQTLAFYGDTVAFDATMNLSNSYVKMDSSRVSVNSSLSINTGNFALDSLHLNAGLTFDNANDSITSSNVDVAASQTLSMQNAVISNSTLAFALSSKLTDANAFTSSGSTFYLDTANTLSASSITSTNDNFVVSGTSKVSSSNAATLSGTNVTLNGASTLTASSFTATNGSITMNNTAKLTSSNAVTLTGTNVTTNGTATITGSSFASTNGSITMNNSSRISSSNAVTFSGTTVAMNNTTTLAASSEAIQSGANVTLTTGASMSITNGLTVSASDVTIGGNSAISDNTTTIENDSYFLIGDWTNGTAHLSTTNGFSVLDNSNLAISNNNNYLHTSATTYATGTGSTSVSISGNNISCGGGSPENACASGTVFGCATLNKSGAVGCQALALATLNLTAVLAGSDVVALSWTDAQNNTADQYLVERSAGNDDWTTLAAMTANAYTGDYHFEDPAAPAGAIEYRIARVGQDGSTLYSAVSTLTITNTSNRIGIYPNPATGHTFFITVPNTDKLVVNLFTLTGQLLMRTTLQGSTQYPVQLPSQALPGMTIIVQTIGQEQTASFPLLLR